MGVGGVMLMFKNILLTPLKHMCTLVFWAIKMTFCVYVVTSSLENIE